MRWQCIEIAVQNRILCTAVHQQCSEYTEYVFCGTLQLYSSNYQSVTQEMLITQSSHLAEGKACLASTPESQEDKQSGAFCVEQQ